MDEGQQTVITALLLVCALQIPTGTHLVTLTTYYEHQDPSKSATRPYTYSTSEYVIGPGTVEAVAEGHPEAFEWYVDGESILTCGEIPWPATGDRIFRDGFERGDTSRWAGPVLGQEKRDKLSAAKRWKRLLFSNGKVLLIEPDNGRSALQKPSSLEMLRYQ